MAGEARQLGSGPKPCQLGLCVWKCPRRRKTGVSRS